MEVDMQQAAFRTPRNGSTQKRPRSPPSPSHLERPSKRLSFGVNNSVSIPLSQLTGAGVPPSPHARSRQTSEDSVIQQTRGLRIVGDGNSPVPEQRAFTPILEDSEPHANYPASPRVDGDMVRICQPVPDGSNENYNLPAYPISYFGSVGGYNQLMDSDEPMPSPPPHVPPNSPAQMEMPSHLSSSTHLDHTTALAHTLRRTQFDILSPTFQPSTPYDSHPSTPLALPSEPSEEPQDISMRSPRLPSRTTSTIRKQKFTMGPRADCEKCRMGVKGHWMHFE